MKIKSACIGALPQGLACGPLAATAATAAAAPAFDEIAARIRPEHPRLFLTRDGVDALRVRARGVAAEAFAELQKRADEYPDQPRFAIKEDRAELVDGKLVFRPGQTVDQFAATMAVENPGGVAALECAIAYLVTGERRYFDKAVKFLDITVQFVEFADRHRLLSEWYNSQRLSALVAYDWLHNELDPEWRKNFLGPMLRHVERMRKPGYQTNPGGPSTGNYGERSLWWFAGLAAWNDGVEEQLVENLLRDGYNHNVAMMDLREEISAGSGLLASNCSGYSFGWYPWASFNFMHTLESAAGFDASQVWTQMRDYGNWFSWSAIPHPSTKDGFLDFGWGDALHINNVMSSWLMYTHLAQTIHFYGGRYPDRARQARAVMARLPEHIRKILNRRHYPFASFILNRFDPDAEDDIAPALALGAERGAHFPSFGLTIMRSGVEPGDTYAAFKGGALHSQHQHYDENSFIIYRKGFQALDTGERGSSPHHRVYYPQTVAHNSLLIRMPGEPLPGYWYPSAAVERVPAGLECDGGQFRMRVAQSLGFEQSPHHVATGADATRTYHPDKCREAVRQFVFVPPNHFVVYDRATSTKPEYEKAWLWHSQNEPERQADGAWKGVADEGALFVRTLLPADADAEVIGGSGKEYWTNGQNWPMPQYAEKLAGPNWSGRYRLEVKKSGASGKVRFLHLLQAADAATPSMTSTRVFQTEAEDGVEFDLEDGRRARVSFARDGDVHGHIRVEAADGSPLVDQPLLQPRAVLDNPPVKVAAAAPKSEAKPKNDPAAFARVDVYGKDDAEIEAGEHGGAELWESPRWMKGGRLATFAAGPDWGEANFSYRAKNAGNFLIRLMGPDVRVDDKRQPVWVEYSALDVDGRALIEDGKTVKVWHDQARTFTVPVKDGREIPLRIRFRRIEAPAKDEK